MGKRRIIIPGEKKKIREEFEKVRQEKGPLSAEQKEEIASQVHKKMKRKAAIIALLAALGLTATGIGVKTLGTPKENSDSSKQEQENQEDFKGKYKVAAEDLEKISNQEMGQVDIKEIVNNLENQEDILNFLKDMYIEQYEKSTGDSTLTTQDIKITSNYENYVFVDNDTGEMYLHGELPKVTEQKLEERGISYTSQDNVKVYKVIKDEKVIDCITIKNKDGKDVPTKVNIEGNQSPSVLEQMGKVIPNGITYAENNKDDFAKRQFVKSFEQKEQPQEEKEPEIL